ncbi:MAG: hypothetical protein A2284_14600 [Deltaproteobacteria bacterium RIFOXYA12_FULL_61_11]|nr:MAG: hypothetical protein A2284_14600 [Deltaproteobacteria bacterium RIFOXYA12_FULL_61_11]
MKKDILVVDDELDQRDYLKALLEDHGYSVRTAADGLEAMQRVKEATPDLVLLDLQMPEETGTGFYRKLHQHSELRTIPVIVISGLAGRDVAVSKSVVVLDKPLDEARVLEEVRRVFPD